MARFVALNASQMQCSAATIPAKGSSDSLISISITKSDLSFNIFDKYISFFDKEVISRLNKLKMHPKAKDKRNDEMRRLAIRQSTYPLSWVNKDYEFGRLGAE